MPREAFGWGNFGLRLLFALVLVGATFNPTGYSYYHWTVPALPAVGPEQAVAGIVLLCGWIIYLRATFRSLGPIGIGLVVALSAALVWLLVSWGVLAPENTDVMQYVILAVIAVVLAVGMSWSNVRRRLTGQTDVDDVET